MLATLDLRYDVIDVLGMLAAILTQLFIPKEYRPSAEGNRPAIRNIDESAKPHDGRHLECIGLGTPCVARVGDHVCPVPEEKHNRSTRRNH